MNRARFAVRQGREMKSNAGEGAQRGGGEGRVCVCARVIALRTAEA